MSEIYDLIIIGAGPAGLSAGIYAGRAGLRSVILEKNQTGGQAALTDRIENYPGFPGGISGYELIGTFENQVKNLGLEILNQGVKKISKKDALFEVESGQNQKYQTSAIIIASGAYPRKLDIPGESEFTGRGVSYCATCDGPLFKGKTVAVIGGGNAAVEEALFLAKLAKRVALVHRRDKLRAVTILEERIKACKNVEIFWSSIPVEISGEGKVETLKIKNVLDNKQTSLNLDAVFIFIGWEPNTGFLKELIKLDEAGYILTAADLATSHPGIFAAGDCREKSLRQIVTACGDGALAAVSAQSYLEQKSK